MAIVLRPATPGDAEAIAGVYNQSVTGSTATFDTEPKDAAEREAWLAGHDERHPVLVAETFGEVVAWGALSRYHERPAYDLTVEMSVYVDESHTRRGIGRALHAELLRLAQELGYHVVIAQVSSENEASASLVGSLGFEEVGRLRELGRKFGRWLDVVVFERVLAED